MQVAYNNRLTVPARDKVVVKSAKKVWHHTTIRLSDFASMLLPIITISDNMPVLKRCISEMSMIVFRATHSGERAWREEYLKYTYTTNYIIYCFT